jgi:hypothetical protein
MEPEMLPYFNTQQLINKTKNLKLITPPIDISRAKCPAWFLAWLDLETRN